MIRYRIVDSGRRDFCRAVAGITTALWFAASPLAVRAQTAGAAPLKIGMIGSGRMGGALGSAWVKAGHPVMFSSRHPEQLKDLVAGLGPMASVGTPAEAIAFADVVVLVVPYTAEKQIGQDFGPGARQQGAGARREQPDRAARRRDRRLGARERRRSRHHGIDAGRASGARLQRRRLHLGARCTRRSRDITAYRWPGDDPAAIAVASTLAREVGYEPVLVGPLAMGKYLIPGTPLAGEHTPEEIRQIAAGLK